MLEIETKLSMTFHSQTDEQTWRIKQELKQYLRIYIDHRKGNWLATAGFAFNNKVHISTKSLLFKVNYGREPRISFEKGKDMKAEEFVKKMKEIYEETKVALKKSQKEMKKYTDRNKKKAVEYKVKNRVLLSIKDLMWQMRNRDIKKLIEKFVGPYKIKKIISENTVELELLVLMKIHLVVYVSRIVIYQKQIEEQKKILPPLVEIDREKKYEVEKILNRRDIREKQNYLVRWKGYIAEEDTWERLENLGNAIDLVEEFEKEIGGEEIRRVQMRKEKEKEKVLNPEVEMFERSELPGKYIAKNLFEWDDGKFENEYLKKLERS